MTERLTLHPVTTEGQLLQQISTQLDELIDIVRPAAPSVEPVQADAPAAGEPEPKPIAKKAPTKKAATRKRVTGQ